MSFCRKLWFSNSYIFVTNVVDFVYFKIWIVLDQAVLDQAVWDKGIGNFERLSVYANSKKNFGTHAYCSMLVCESCLWFGTRLFPLPLLYPLLHLRNSRWVYDNPPPFSYNPPFLVCSLLTLLSKLSVNFPAGALHIQKYQNKFEKKNKMINDIGPLSL